MTRLHVFSVTEKDRVLCQYVVLFAQLYFQIHF